MIRSASYQVLSECHGKQRQTYETVDDMLGVWVIVRLYTLLADKVHDLMFTFTRYRSVRDDDCELSCQDVLMSMNLNRKHYD